MINGDYKKRADKVSARKRDKQRNIMLRAVVHELRISTPERLHVMVPLDEDTYEIWKRASSKNTICTSTTRINFKKKDQVLITTITLELVNSSRISCQHEMSKTDPRFWSNILLSTFRRCLLRDLEWDLYPLDLGHPLYDHFNTSSIQALDTYVCHKDLSKLEYYNYSYKIVEESKGVTTYQIINYNMFRKLQALWKAAPSLTVSGKDVIFLIEKPKEFKLIAQGLWDISLDTKTAEIADKFNEVIERGVPLSLQVSDDTLNSFSEIMSKIKVDMNLADKPELMSLFSELSSSFPSMTDVNVKINPNVPAIGSAILLFAVFSYHCRNASNASILVLSSFTCYLCYTHYEDIKSMLNNTIEYIISFYKQPELVAQIGSSTIQDFTNAFVVLLSTYITGSAPIGRRLNEGVRIFSNYSKLSKSFFDIAQWSLECVEKLVNYFRMEILEESPIRFIDSHNDELNEFIDTVFKIQGKVNAKDFVYNIENSMLLDDLWENASKLLKLMPNNKELSSFRVTMTGCMKFLSDLRSQMSSRNLHFSGLRPEPCAIMFLGPPGVGKSYAMQHLSNFLLPHLLPESKHSQLREDPNRFVHNRQSENVYWDGYNADSVICIFDDFGQARDVVGNADNEYMNWIRAMNIFPYQLHMADLEQKACSRFGSSFVIGNSNLPTFNPESIISSEALYRRMKRTYVVCPKKPYVTEATSMCPPMGRMLDASKLPCGTDLSSTLTPDILEFHEYSPAKVEYSGTVYDFSDIQEICLKDIELSMKRFKQYVSELHVTLDTQIKVVSENYGFHWPERGFTSDYINEPCFKELWESLQSKDKRGYMRQAIYTLISQEFDWVFDLETAVHAISAAVSIDQDYFIEFLSLIDIGDTHFCSTFPTFWRSLDVEQHVFKPPVVQANTRLSKQPNKLIEEMTVLQDTLGNSLTRVDKFKEYIPIILKSVVGISSAISLFLIFDKIFHISDNLRKKVSDIFGQSYGMRQSKPVTAQRIANLRSQMGCGYDKANIEIVNKIFKKNVYEMHLSPPSEGLPKVGLVTFIKGRIFMCNKHFQDQLVFSIEEGVMNMETPIYFSRPGSKQSAFNIPADTMLDIFLTPDYLEDQDVVFIQCPPYVPTHSTITKYFCKYTDIANKGAIPVRLTVTTEEGKDNWVGTAVPISNRKVTYPDEKYGEYTVNRGFFMDAPTDSGDCGALLSYMQKGSDNRKLLGFHTAGNTGVAVSSIIFQEDIERVLSDSTFHTNVEEVTDFIVYPESGFNQYLAPTHTPLMDSEFCNNPYGVSKIVRSPLTGCIGPCTMLPSRVNKYYEKGILVDPLLAAVAKYSSSDLPIRKSVIERIAQSYADDLRFASTISVSPRKLTYEEAVKGIEGEPDFTGISRSTSSGYPYSVDPSIKGKGKFWIWGDGDTYDLDNIEALQLKEDVLKLEQTLRENKRPLFVFLDMLKSETLPSEKVKAGKTRLYSATELKLLILYRMYFGSYSLWCMKNKIDNGFAVGVNPYSFDWHRIALRLAAFSGPDTLSFGDGDYSSYDTRERPIFHNAIIEIINRFYNDPVDNRIRSVLWNEVYFSRHIINHSIVEWNGSLPSGHPLTALINNHYNGLLFRWAWLYSNDMDLSCLSEFRFNVYAIYLGDDNIFSVSPKAKDIFTFDKIVEAMDRVGMVYTSADKTTVTGYKTLMKLSFLKRSFRYEPLLAQWLAPLDLKSIQKILYWTKRGELHHQIVYDNTVLAIQELSLHGEDTYNKYVPQIDASWNKHMSRYKGKLPFLDFRTNLKLATSKELMF